MQSSNLLAGLRLSKRTLALGYLAGTGVVLTGLLLVVGLRSIGTDTLAAVGAFSGVLPSASLVSVRYWLPRQDLDDDQVWTIAMWGGLGIALLTVVVIGIVLTTSSFSWEMAVLASNVAVGGVAGVLIGGTYEFSRTTRTLSQKNAVLNRVLRHDLRNAMGVIQAYAEILEEDVPESYEEHTATIQNYVDEVIDLSLTARRIQRTISGGSDTQQPIDLVPIVEERLTRLHEAHPAATFETDLPNEAWVHADDLVDSVVHNVVQNAIEHTGENDPVVSISVSVTSNEKIELCIEDDGPGLPEEEIELLSGGKETPLNHSMGVGLWLVKWLVEYYGGSVTFEQAAPSGTAVCISLPRAQGSALFG